MADRDEDVPQENQEGPGIEEKQCRICMDGLASEHELGRLVMPCLCRGSMSYVHLKCLQRWRTASASRSAFFSCPVCHYRYRFARLKFAGMATNPIILGAVSCFLLALMSYASSFVTTYTMAAFQNPSIYSPISWLTVVYPINMVADMVPRAVQYIEEEGVLDNIPYLRSHSIVQTTVFRLILGLPLVGAASILHFFFSVPGRYYGGYGSRYNNRRSQRETSSRDPMTILALTILAVGVARALWKFYKRTQVMAYQILYRAEEAILEVN